LEATPPLQSALTVPTESGDASPVAIRETGPVIDIHTLSVVPEEVPAGSLLEVRIDLFTENPQESASKIAVTLSYAISQDGKVLKQFAPETFHVFNGEPDTIAKKTRATKTPGDYTVDVVFELDGQKAQRSASFSIK